MEDYVFLDRLWSDWSPGYDATEDLSFVKASIGSPERIVAAVSYYRALYDGTLHKDEYAAEQAATNAVTPCPTLYLHGATDQCFALRATGNPLEFLGEGSKMEVIEGAGHFLHLEQPAVVNELIVSFLEDAS
jgi:pimeloyl-ACP methyl ester carboxylesterase